MVHFRRNDFFRAARLLFALCAAALLILAPAGPASAQAQAWAFDKGDPGGSGADKFAFAAFPWQPGYSARVHFDPEAAEWVFLLLYPGQDDEPRPRSIAAHYLPDVARGRDGDVWEWLDYAPADYATFVVDGGQSTLVAFAIPASFVAHMKRADAVVVDAGQDAIRVPLTGSARAIAEVEARMAPPAAEQGDAVTLADILSNSGTRRRGEEEQPGDFLDAPASQAAAQADPTPDADAFSDLVSDLCDYEILSAEDFIDAGFAAPDDLEAFCHDLMWGRPQLIPLGTGAGRALAAAPDPAGLPPVPSWAPFLCEIDAIPDYVICLNADTAAMGVQAESFAKALAAHAGLSPDDPALLDRLDPLPAARAIEVRTSFAARMRDRQAVVERQLDAWFTLPERETCYAPALVPGGTIPDMDIFNLGYSNYIGCQNEDVSNARALVRQRQADLNAATGLRMPEGFQPSFTTLARDRLETMVQAYNDRHSRVREEAEAWEAEATRIYGVTFQ